MKYLLILLLILVVAWRWRTARTTEHRVHAQKAAASQGPVAMVRCAHCGTHVPEQDAVAGRTALYCSPAHRALQER